LRKKAITITTIDSEVCFRGCENSVDGGDESQVVERAVVALPVDEEVRGAVDSAADAAGEIGADWAIVSMPEADFCQRILTNSLQRQGSLAIWKRWNLGILDFDSYGPIGK
jgi:hypothetical protein